MVILCPSCPLLTQAHHTFSLKPLPVNPTVSLMPSQEAVLPQDRLTPSSHSQMDPAGKAGLCLLLSRSPQPE